MNQDNTHVVYVPCEIIRVQAYSVPEKAKMPLEQLVLKAIGASERPLTLDQVTSMFGIGNRPTLDLVQDLWMQGYLAVHPTFATLHLTQRTKRQLADGSLEIESANWEEENVVLLRELVTGHILPVTRSIMNRSGFELPAVLDPSGGRLSDTETAEMIEVVQHRLKRTFANRERRLLQAIPQTTPREIPVALCFVALRVRLSRNSATEDLVFDVRQPQKILARVRVKIGEQLGRSARADSNLYVFKNLAARVPKSADNVGDPLERAVAHLEDGCRELQRCQPSAAPNLHEVCKGYAEDVIAHLRGSLTKAAAISVLSSNGEFEDAVRSAIRTAERQLILVCPVGTWEGYARFQNELVEAVRSRELRVFIVWGGEPNQQFARGIMQLRAEARQGAVYRSTEPARVQARMVIRDADLAIVGSANFLGGKSSSVEMGCVVQSAAVGEPSELVTELIGWARSQMRELVQRQAVWQPGTSSEQQQELPLPPSAPLVSTEGFRNDQGERAASLVLLRSQWQLFLAQVRLMASHGSTKPRMVIDEMHRALLVQGIRDAKWRLLISSEWISETAFDASVERAIRARLAEGLPIAIVVSNVRSEGGQSPLADRLEEIKKDYQSNFSLVKTANHSKVLVWDDQSVVTSFDFLSFLGQYGGAKGYKAPHHLGIHSANATQVDEIVAGLSRRVDPALDEWRSVAVRPEFDAAVMAFSEVAASGDAYSAGEQTAREVRRLLQNLNLAGANSDSRVAQIRSFFERTPRPAEVLAKLTGEEGESATAYPALLAGDDLHVALLCGLRRQETRLHRARARWVYHAAARLWSQGQFFPTAALLSTLDDAAQKSPANVPSTRVAFLAAVTDDEITFASRLQALLMAPHDIDEAIAACLLGVWALAKYGGEARAEALKAALGSSDSPAVRLATAYLTNWWEPTNNELPISMILQLAQAQSVEEIRDVLRDEALIAFRHGMQPNRFPTFGPGDDTLREIFGPSGSLRAIHLATEADDPMRVRELLREAGRADSVVQTAWGRARDRAERLEGPPRRSITRLAESALAAARRWSDAAIASPSSLPEYMRAAAIDLQSSMLEPWHELRSTSKSPSLDVLFDMCAEYLKPIMELRSPSSGATPRSS